MKIDGFIDKTIVYLYPRLGGYLPCILWVFCKRGNWHEWFFENLICLLMLPFFKKDRLKDPKYPQ